jgi:SNF2 family DNA or RNA helicase
MGLGKTFVGAEKLIDLGAKVNLVICQKSKIEDWKSHFFDNYKDISVYDLTDKKEFPLFIQYVTYQHEFTPVIIGFINYELAFRRPELLQLKDFTLMLDESSMIQNETAKRTKFIMKLNFKNLILLSGTPTSGKYENLWSQLHLLGWNISKELYWRQYVDTEVIDNQGFPIKIVKGYKNVDRLKQKMRDYGCRFLKTDEVFDLPDQIWNTVKVPASKEYWKFKKDRIITINDTELVGDTILTKLLYERMLCGSYSSNKLEALKDLLISTEDRVIVFYNFNDELKAIEDLCIELDKPVSIVNGQTKDLSMYDEYNNTVTLIQYQAGSMGLNLQKANKIVYFTPTLSSELFEQSKKRIHIIGQDQACFYYKLICTGSVEEKIYETLDMRKDFTDFLFEEVENGI